MEQISSSGQPLFARLAVYAMGVLLFLGMVATLRRQEPVDWEAYIIFPFGFAFLWFIARRVLRAENDAVFDDGDSLLVVTDGQEERIPLTDFSRVSAHRNWVSLHLRFPRQRRSVITFQAPMNPLSFTGPPIVDELEHRIRRAHLANRPPGGAPVAPPTAPRPAPMPLPIVPRRISSRATLLFKYVLPAGFLLGIAAFVWALWTGQDQMGISEKIASVFFLLLAAAIVFGVWGSLFGGLIASVWDAGDAIIVHHRGEKGVFPLHIIRSVEWNMTLPPSITISADYDLRREYVIQFMPRFRLTFRAEMHPVAADLAERVERARQALPSSGPAAAPTQ